MEKLPVIPIMPEKMELNTFAGRHYRLMQRLPKLVSGRAKKPVVWVVGIGQNRFLNYPGTEHLEVARALEKTGLNYKVYAVDPDPEVIAAARKTLKSGRLEIPQRDLQYVRQCSPKDYPAHKDYVESVFGHLAEKGNLVYSIPDKIKRRITLLGPQPEGDILTSMPREQPDFILVLNVATHQDQEKQEQMAEFLSKALKHNGMLITTNAHNQEHFSAKLKELLTPEEETSAPGIHCDAGLKTTIFTSRRKPVH